MQILSANQVRDWDAYTILHEPVASIDLMERAAMACYLWLQQNGFQEQSFSIFCGKGNNGGDGLAIARLLIQNNQKVTVYILEFGHKGTEDFQANLARLHETKATIKFISSAEMLSPVEDEVIIDALYGSGLNRPLDGLSAKAVEHINASGARKLSIDLPSGLFADQSSIGNTVVRADHTLSFQCYKPALLVAENADYIGNVHILDIGLHPGFLQQVSCNMFMIDRKMVQPLFKKRNPFSHKGSFGHAAIIAGSKGMMGAAVLSAKACLRAGAGKLTCHTPGLGYNIMQISVPEAMCISDGEQDHINQISLPEGYSSIGVGPGMGIHRSMAGLMEQLFKQYQKPIVIDADAVNAIAASQGLLQKVPPNSILTPHVKEFERLFGRCRNDFERMEMALNNSGKLGVIIILKGHHTLIATPQGKMFFNTTGNPGMATGGSGDVLTGILTALLAQGYEPLHAALLGVFLHGLSGDLAAALSSQESLTATDLIEYLGNAFRELY